MTHVRIPTPLRPYTGGQSSVNAAGDNVAAVLADLTRQYPDLRQHLYEGEALRSFVNVYLNKEDVRHLDGEDTGVSDNDTLMIVPSIAGGSARVT
ncbi:MAG: MoaD/ThiS family protein [Candidatus Promineifilaceae bacterium]